MRITVNSADAVAKCKELEIENGGLRNLIEKLEEWGDEQNMVINDQAALRKALRPTLRSKPCSKRYNNAN